MWIFLALVAVPIIEIALFIQVGGLIGLIPTLAIVILTAVAGTWLLRQQGIGALQRLQAALQQGGDPRGPLAHGAMILISGVLLLTPGFFTDALGFALLVPAFRNIVISTVAKRMTMATFSAGAHRQHPHSSSNDDIIDVDFEIDVPSDDAPRGTSEWTKPK